MENSKITLRPYQKDAIDRLLEFDKACMEAPCGAGKSIMIAEIARRLQNQKILMLVPSKELCEQNLEKLNLLGVPTSVYSASMNQKNLSRITLGTPLSLVKAEKLDFDVLLIDECHFCPIEPPQPTKKKVGRKWVQVQSRPTYWKIIDKVKPKRIYGFTGTPYRICSKAIRVDWQKFYSISTIKHIGLLWKNMVQSISIVELQNMGYLSRTHYHVWDVDYSRFRFTSSGEVKDDDVRKFENETTDELLATIKHALRAHQKLAKVVVFVNSINYVDYITKRLQDDSVRAGAIHSKTKKKDREAIVDGFKNGDVQVIVNDTVVQVGFDSPNITDIVWAKLTSSPNVYVQSIGRGLRKMEGKLAVEVYDIAGSFNKFGPVEDICSVKQGDNWEVSAKGRIISGLEMKTLLTRTPKKLDKKEN